MGGEGGRGAARRRERAIGRRDMDSRGRFPVVASQGPPPPPKGSLTGNRLSREPWTVDLRRMVRHASLSALLLPMATRPEPLWWPLQCIREVRERSAGRRI